MSDRAKTVLRGMTWDHSRGYLPMVATAQRWNELHPEVEVVWEKRSLKDFEEYPVEVLAKQYDLIIIDHPFSGYAAKNGPLLALDEAMPVAFLADQEKHSVGKSHESYCFGGHQWALAIDAAAPVAFWREDLLERLGVAAPVTWEEVLELAKRGGVEIPAAPINCLMNFYTFCIAGGEVPFLTEERVVEESVGVWAIERLRELIALCDSECLNGNPIASHDLVSSAENESIAYCPFAYGYSNYARDDYAAHRLTFGDAPQYGGKPLHTTLGGTGLALSALRGNAEEAALYAEFAASGAAQRTIGTWSGGQPGHKTAWTDALNNRMCHGYFENTLPTLDRAFLRPRYCGYTRFQEEGGPIVHAAIRGELKDADAIDNLNTLYRDTLKEGSAAL